VCIGSDWSRRLFDGDFYRSPEYRADRPAVSLVFVQSRNGNTVAPDPSTLGGGDTDKHLVYEGLSRVDADAVMAGAATVRSGRIVLSIWHPELVALRTALGRTRHPAQVVVTDRGDLPFEDGLMFAEPSVRVFVITRSLISALLRERVRHRPWIEIIDAGDPVSLTVGLKHLRRRGIHVISAIGGRRTATALLREGLVSDLYLTTSPIDAGEPNTPYYEGPPLRLTRVLEKAGRGPEAGVRFEHYLIASDPV
jgi:riboflavin biosynthesis pyrimidine reductase